MDKEAGLEMRFEYASVYSDGDDVVVGCSGGCCQNHLSRKEAIETARAILNHFNEKL